MMEFIQFDTNKEAIEFINNLEMKHSVASSGMTSGNGFWFELKYDANESVNYETYQRKQTIDWLKNGKPIIDPELIREALLKENRLQKGTEKLCQQNPNRKRRQQLKPIKQSPR